MTKLFSILAVMAAAMMTAGCASATRGVRAYPGDARPADAVAQIVAASEFGVKSVDGAKHEGAMFSTAKQVVFEVLPGPHEIVARFYSPMEGAVTSGGATYDRPDRSGYQTLRLDAAAGRRYAIKRRTEGREVRLFIEETGPAVPLGSAAVTMMPEQEKPATPAAAEPAAAKAINAPPATVAAAPVKDERVEAPKITPLDNLKQWWFYATPQERAQFRQWIDAAK